MSLALVAGLFFWPMLGWVFLYARAKGHTATWEQRHPVISKLVGAFASWCAAAGIVMAMVAALIGLVAVSRSGSPGWLWAIGLAAVLSIGFVGERLRLAKRGLSPSNTGGHLRLVALTAWPCVVAVISGPAAGVGVLAIEATALMGMYIARVSGRPDPSAPTI